MGYGILFRFDINSKGGGLLFYIGEGIPTKFVKLRSDCNMENICVELNSKKRRCFINGSYNPNKSLISNHIECLAFRRLKRHY